MALISIFQGGFVSFSKIVVLALMLSVAYTMPAHAIDVEFGVGLMGPTDCNDPFYNGGGCAVDAWGKNSYGQEPYAKHKASGYYWKLGGNKSAQPRARYECYARNGRRAVFAGRDRDLNSALDTAMANCKLESSRPRTCRLMIDISKPDNGCTHIR